MRDPSKVHDCQANGRAPEDDGDFTLQGAFPDDDRPWAGDVVARPYVDAGWQARRWGSTQVPEVVIAGFE
eukprot:2815563-Heterocapsa_arctica.AAC.1